VIGDIVAVEIAEIGPNSLAAVPAGARQKEEAMA
jgi:hypothetical protein